MSWEDGGTGVGGQCRWGMEQKIMGERRIQRGEENAWESEGRSEKEECKAKKSFRYFFTLFTNPFKPKLLRGGKNTTRGK